MLLTMALVFGIFYFLIIRPGQKREKERQAMLQAIAPGETVVTTGGLVGKVTGTSERYIVMEISPKVRVRVLRTNIAGKEEPEDGQKKAVKKSKGKKKDGDQGKGRTSSSTSDNKSGADDA